MSEPTAPPEAAGLVSASSFAVASPFGDPATPANRAVAASAAADAPGRVTASSSAVPGATDAAPQPGWSVSHVILRPGARPDAWRDPVLVIRLDPPFADPAPAPATAPPPPAAVTAAVSDAVTASAPAPAPAPVFASLRPMARPGHIVHDSGLVRTGATMRPRLRDDVRTGAPLRPRLRDDSILAGPVPATGHILHDSSLVRTGATMRPRLRDDVRTGATKRPRLRDDSILAGPVPAMRWDHRPDAAQWTRATLAAVRASGLTEIVPDDIATWCPAYPHAGERDRAAFWAGVLSALARYESTHDPRAVGGGGLYYGLLQILPSTARHYGCEARTAEALQDGPANLECAVRIAARNITRDDAVARDDGRNAGIARDWGPMTVAARRAEMAAWTSTQDYCSAPATVLAAPLPPARPWTLRTAAINADAGRVNLAMLSDEIRDLRAIPPPRS